MFLFMIYTYRFYSGWIGMNSADDYIGILAFTIWFIFNEYILQFQPTLNVSFSKWVCNYYIYSGYNPVSGINILLAIMLPYFTITTISIQDVLSNSFRQHYMMAYLYNLIIYILSVGLKQRELNEYCWQVY